VVTAGFSGRRRNRHCARSRSVAKHEAGIRAVGQAFLAKGSLTGSEAHQIFNRAYWPAAALAMIGE